MVKKYLGGDNGYMLGQYLRNTKKKHKPPFVKLLERQKAKEKGEISEKNKNQG